MSCSSISADSARVVACSVGGGEVEEWDEGALRELLGGKLVGKGGGGWERGVEFGRRVRQVLLCE